MDCCMLALVVPDADIFEPEDHWCERYNNEPSLLLHKIHAEVLQQRARSSTLAATRARPVDRCSVQLFRPRKVTLPPSFPHCCCLRWRHMAKWHGRLPPSLVARGPLR